MPSWKGSSQLFYPLLHRPVHFFLRWKPFPPMSTFREVKVWYYLGVPLSRIFNQAYAIAGPKQQDAMTFFWLKLWLWIRSRSKEQSWDTTVETVFWFQTLWKMLTNVFPSQQDSGWRRRFHTWGEIGSNIFTRDSSGSTVSKILTSRPFLTTLRAPVHLVSERGSYIGHDLHTNGTVECTNIVR